MVDNKEEAKYLIEKSKNFKKLFCHNKIPDDYLYPDVLIARSRNQIDNLEVGTSKDFQDRIQTLKTLEKNSILNEQRSKQKHATSANFKQKVIFSQSRNSAIERDKKNIKLLSQHLKNPKDTRPRTVFKSYTDPMMKRNSRNTQSTNSASETQKKKLTPKLTPSPPQALTPYEKQLLYNKIEDARLKPNINQIKNDLIRYRIVKDKELVQRRRFSVANHIQRFSNQNEADSKKTLRKLSSLDKAKSNSLRKYKSKLTSSDPQKLILRDLESLKLKEAQETYLKESSSTLSARENNYFIEPNKQAITETKSYIVDTSVHGIVTSSPTKTTSSPTKTKFYMKFVKRNTEELIAEGPTYNSQPYRLEKRRHTVGPTKTVKEMKVLPPDKEDLYS